MDDSCHDANRRLERVDPHEFISALGRDLKITKIQWFRRRIHKKTDRPIFITGFNSIDRDVNLLSELARDVDGLYVSSPEIPSTI